MRVVDLTHCIEEGMPVFPGTEPPRLTPANTLEKDGFRETLLSLYSHTGTHMDAPAHMLGEGATLDVLAADRFLGPALVVDVSDLRGASVTAERLATHREALGRAEYLLLRTRWDRFWGQEAYFGPFPCLTREAAAWLGAFPLKGVGADAISFDPMDSPDFPVHRTLLGRGVVLVENLTGLDGLPEEEFLFGAFPLRYALADGAPVRAVGMLP